MKHESFGGQNNLVILREIIGVKRPEESSIVPQTHGIQNGKRYPF